MKHLKHYKKNRRRTKELIKKKNQKNSSIENSRINRVYVTKKHLFNECYYLIKKLRSIE
jgi:hypothetical protein